MQVPNPERDEPDWQQGYGFQLWMSRHGYRGDGGVRPVHGRAPRAGRRGRDVLVRRGDADRPRRHVAPPPAPRWATTSRNRRPTTRRSPNVSRPLRSPPPPTASAAALPGTLAASFVRTAGEPSHPTVTRIDAMGERMTIHEGDTSFEVPLTARVDGDRRPVRHRARRGSPTAGSRSTWSCSPPPTGWRSSSTRPPARSSPAGRSCRCSAPDSAPTSRRCAHPTERRGDEIAGRQAAGESRRDRRRQRAGGDALRDRQPVGPADDRDVRVLESTHEPTQTPRWHVVHDVGRHDHQIGGFDPVDHVLLLRPVGDDDHPVAVTVAVTLRGRSRARTARGRLVVAQHHEGDIGPLRGGAGRRRPSTPRPRAATRDAAGRVWTTMRSHGRTRWAAIVGTGDA